MPSRLSDAVRRLPVLRRPRRRGVRNASSQPRSRPARAPYVLMLSARRIARRNLPEAVVPYLRMSGRWLEEHGFGIGTVVRVLVETDGRRSSAKPRMPEVTAGR